MERDLINVIGRFLEERDDGPRNEEPMESPIQEIEWERALQRENAQARQAMALELAQMNFSPDAIARLLHLEECCPQSQHRNEEPVPRVDGKE